MKKYLYSVRSTVPPMLEQIPAGMWAELAPGDLNWKIFCSWTRDNIPALIRSKF
jgi:hypothetical protein